MKIKQEHFDHIKLAIDATLAIHNQNNKLAEEYEQGLFPRAELTKDVQRRFCWDVMYGAGLSKFASDTLYSYLNDDHIYTALKAICPTLKLGE
jgi:GH24 family phage-related lysozyme (muramidase)